MPKLIQIIFPHSNILCGLTPEEFEKELQIKWLPKLEFEPGILGKIAKQVRNAIRYEEIDARMRWLGAYYAPYILQPGQGPDLTIKWINEEIGYGVITNEDLPPRAYVSEYTGFVRKKRFERLTNTYCFAYEIGEQSKYVIDAKRHGNYARFINHSDRPNVETVSVYHNGLIRVILLTLVPIKKGTQLLYDYGPYFWTKRKFKQQIN